MKLSTRLFMAAAALAPVHASLDGCLAALSTLLAAPNNISLPFLNGMNGRINVGYLYQQPGLAVLPNELMGNYDLCRFAREYSPTPFDTQYCALARDTAGVCVPAACTAEDLKDPGLIQPLINLAVQATMGVPMDCIFDAYLTQRCADRRQGWEYFQSLYNLLILYRNGGPANRGKIHCGESEIPADAGSYATIVFTVLFIVLAITGALWDETCKNDTINAIYSAFYPPPPPVNVPSPVPPKASPPKFAGSPTKGGKVETGEFQDVSLNDESKKQPIVAVSQKAAKATTPAPAPQEYISIPQPPKFLDAFALNKNFEETFKLSSRVGEFSCFDAMRAISAAWVIFYHVILWQIYYIQNPEVLVPPKGMLGQWWAAPFFNYSGTLSVDTFFFISAFLAAYLLLQKLDKEELKGGNKPIHKWLPMFYLHRYLRVTPAYAFAFFLHWKVAPLLATGPTAQQLWAYNNTPCEDSWWKHMLYINDVDPWWNQRFGSVCYGHSWYLANDMQFFLLVPIFVLIYRSKHRFGRWIACAAVSACLLVCIISSAVLTVKDHWSPISWDSAEGTNYREQGFSRPWIRCASYMIGILTAFAWYEKKKHYPDFKFSTRQVRLIAFFSAALLAISMYAPYTGTHNKRMCVMGVTAKGMDQPCGSQWSVAEKALTIALLRPTWTIGILGMCVLCWNNQGGLIQSFLSKPLWLPLSNLSYTVYLVHYTVLTFYMGQRTLRVRWEFFEFLNIFFGLATISAMLGLFVHLLVERPFMKLQKYYFEPAAPKKVATKTVGK